VNLGLLMSFTVAFPTLCSLDEICDYLHAQSFWNSIGGGAELTLKFLGQSSIVWSQKLKTSDFSRMPDDEVHVPLTGPGWVHFPVQSRSGKVDEGADSNRHTLSLK
jgi:hypothetical protein